MAKLHGRRPDRPGGRDRVRGDAAGPESRVLHADRMASRRMHRGRRAGVRLDSRGSRGSDDDEELKRLCDEKPQKFIFNFVREYGDLEYVNIGRVIGSLSRRPAFYGRRGVYIAVLKLSGQQQRKSCSIIRMQKYGVREYLDDGRQLLDAMIRSEEYTEYILDRRLGCRQLGMNLPTRVTAKRISERYVSVERRSSFVIWSPYFERDYIRGIATDKVPPCRFEDEEFALRFARLLGRAAAPNMIVGRCDLGGNPLVRRRRRSADRGRRKHARRHRGRRSYRHIQRLSERVGNILPRSMPGRSTGESSIFPIPRSLPTPIWTRSWSVSPEFRTITADEERRSTRCSSTARAMRREVSPIAGRECWRASTKPIRANWRS